MRAITIFLLIAISLSHIEGKAQTCEELSKKAGQLYTISNLYDYEFYEGFKSKDELLNNLDSAIQYNEKIIALNECRKYIPHTLSRLALQYYIKSESSKAKTAASSVIDINSEVSHIINGKTFTHDSLIWGKFEAYKILGKIYLNENNEDSLFWTIGVIDSLKNQLYECNTGKGRANSFILELRSNFYQKNRRYNEALLVWQKTNQKGNSYVNKRIMDVLELKYGKKLKTRVRVVKLERNKYKHYATLKIKDDIVSSLLISLPIESTKSSKECLRETEYLEGIF